MFRTSYLRRPKEGCDVLWALLEAPQIWITLSALRSTVELGLASWSPWSHFSALLWKRFKGLWFTPLRTLICLRTTRKLCLQNIYINPSAYPSCSIFERYGKDKAHFVFFFYQHKFHSNIWFSFFSNLCILSSVIFCRTRLLWETRIFLGRKLPSLSL